MAEQKRLYCKTCKQKRLFKRESSLKNSVIGTNRKMLGFFGAFYTGGATLLLMWSVYRCPFCGKARRRF